MAQTTSSDQKQRITEIAVAVRKAILDLVNKRVPVAVRIENTIDGSKFPKDWCDYASCVLALQVARVLQTGHIELVVAEHSKSKKTHWWLKVEGWAVDITADQFEGIDGGIVVADAGKVHEREFSEQSIVPYISRQRQKPCFERLVDHLDRKVNEFVEHECRGLFATCFERVITKSSITQRFASLIEMQEMGVFMLRNRLRNKHPQETEGQINARVARWMGGELQPRDVGGLLAPSKSPRFVSNDE